MEGWGRANVDDVAEVANKADVDEVANEADAAKVVNEADEADEADEVDVANGVDRVDGADVVVVALMENSGRWDLTVDHVTFCHFWQLHPSTSRGKGRRQ